MWRSTRWRIALPVLLLHVDAVVRLLGLLLLEVGIGLWDALHGVFRQSRSLWQELRFLVARVFVCVGLRELITVGAAIDLARGLPVIHVNFLGYDEQAHRRGPDSAFAHWALLGIDRCIRRLHHAARRSGRRDYDVWIFSDHGQLAVRPAAHFIAGGLEALVREHWPYPRAAGPTAGSRRQNRTSPGHWLGGPRAARREEAHSAESRLSALEREEFAVAAMGPVGHIYFGRELGAAETRRLAAALVRAGVPGILWREEPDTVTWLEPGGEHRLPRDAAVLTVDAELREELARDLVALCQHPQAGNLVVLGWAPQGRPCSFAMEHGAHAGPSPDEVTGFALLPPATWLPEEAAHHLRPATLRRAALRRLGRGMPRVEVSSRPEAGPRDDRPREAAAPLRVVTYNVHGCMGGDGRVSPRRVARVLAQFDADIVAVQELDVGRSRSRGEDQVAVIAGELERCSAFCAAVRHDRGSYGHALFTRGPARIRACRPLPGARETRAALAASLDVPGGPIHIIATHLGLGREERWQQVNALLDGDWLGALPAGEPVILCGDLNLHPGSRGYRRLAARLHDVQAHAPGHVARMTFPSFFPLRCLDYIFVSGHFDVAAVHVPRDALTTLTSDHLPLVGDLRLRSPASDAKASRRARQPCETAATASA
jgi:endonuclease/exonuclease/phosphatase family metal-dependent hydrolase